MKKILILLVLVGALALLFMAGNAASTKTTSSTESQASVLSAFTAPETSFDFGTISMKNGKVSRMFSVINASGATQTIKRISTSCMCTEAFLVRQDDSKIGPFGMPGHGGFAPDINDVVPPQETRGIEVVFDPSAHGPAGVGQIERAVFVEDKTGGTNTFTIKARVTP